MRALSSVRRPAFLAAVAAVASFLTGDPVAWAEPVSFKNAIAPVLLENCLACHGPKKAEAGYRVDTFEKAAAGGDSGLDGFLAGDVEGSEAVRRMLSEDADERMPLEADPLPPATVALLRTWIAEGAKYDGKDPQEALISIVPPPQHPAAPEKYPAALPATAMVFSPDGSELIVGGYHELTVWNPVDSQLLRRIGNVGERTYALDISPDGKLLAAAGGAPGKMGEVRLYDLASGELVRALGRTSDVAYAVSFNPQGDRVASGAADGLIRIYQTANGAETLVISSHSDWVMSVAWSPDGKLLAAGSQDKTAKVFNAETGELMQTYNGHTEGVRGVAFHTDGKEVFSGSADKRLSQWKIEDGKKTSDVATFGDEILLVQAAGDWLLAAGADKTVRQFDRKSRNAIRSYAGLEEWALTAAAHPATQRLAGGDFNGQVMVWNTETGELVVKFLAAPGQ
ncbi:WD40 domain-containing protein [Lignipirellula cremea]|uniref:WD domain, G-beta repeat n=1 Tax=Lignipirellula cremea TaxID=2528010 RepID=A0A518DPK2_9BACT|nr:c-type cytochrome domain-containing protein [Lignipirellula cremea]QDU93777.1 WD domain, G-beta repeat [Lignipirellula cremea]